MIFKSCVTKGEFPSEQKKANVVSVHKKSNKQSLKNYRPISLLPIFGKMFVRIIYNNIFDDLMMMMNDDDDDDDEGGDDDELFLWHG